ncbi:hypothetical protein ACWDUN_13605 [Mycobacterium sp. NPDC003323]
MVGNEPFDDDDEVDPADLGSDLAAFDAIFDVPNGDGPSYLDAFADPGVVAEDHPEEPLYTVTNPPGTVTVSALLDGRVHRVELSPEATTTVETEGELAAEIVVIADLATQQARSAQFSYMLEGMQSHGHDSVDTRDFLTRSVGLPSPEQAREAQARVFSTRYAGGHD